VPMRMLDRCFRKSLPQRDLVAVDYLDLNPNLSPGQTRKMRTDSRPAFATTPR